MSTAEQLRGYRERSVRNASEMIAGPGLARVREHVVELAAETEHGQRTLSPVNARESLRRSIETLDDLAGYVHHLADEARKALA